MGNHTHTGTNNNFHNSGLAWQPVELQQIICIWGFKSLTTQKDIHIPDVLVPLCLRESQVFQQYLIVILPGTEIVIAPQGWQDQPLIHTHNL